MKCSGCGVDAQGGFCSACGARLGQPDSQTASINDSVLTSQSSQESGTAILVDVHPAPDQVVESAPAKFGWDTPIPGTE